MTYEATVLSKGPFLYARVDEASGTVAADASGNGYDGEYFPEAVLGQTSPIETDGSSRSVGSRVAFFPDAPAPLNSFSWGGWGYRSGGSGDSAIVGRSGQVGLGNSNYLVIDHGQNRIRAMISTGNSSVELSYTTPAEGFYRALVTRHLNFACLYVQGVLRDATDQLDTGPMVDPAYLDGGIGWRMGCLGATGNLSFGILTDEMDLYEYALAGEDERDIFEAALLNPPISLRADLHFNCYINGAGEPRPQLFPFTPNWENPVKETLEWLTDVMPSCQDYEQRAAVRMRPRRSIEYDFSFLDNRERRLFRAWLFANQKKTIFIPIATDEVRLTAGATAGATELEFDSETFDFNDGGHLALFEDQDTNEVLEIDEVGETSTTLATPTTLDHAIVTARVFPVARAIAPSAIQINRLTDSMEDASIAFRILAEDVPLSPHRLGTYTPRYTLNGIEVFDPFTLGPSNWTEDGKGEVSIRAADPESSAGVFSRTAQDTFPRELTSYSFFLDDRPAIARFLAWWWNMEGRTKPIWVPSMNSDFSVLASVTGPLRVTVADHEQTNFYKVHEARRDLAFCYTDETMVFKRIDSAAASGANDILTLEGFGGVSLTNLWFTSFLKLSRLNEDTITLAWYADDHVELTLNFIDEKPTDDQ